MVRQSFSLSFALPVLSPFKRAPVIAECELSDTAPVTVIEDKLRTEESF